VYKGLLPPVTERLTYGPFADFTLISGSKLRRQNLYIQSVKTGASQPHAYSIYCRGLRIADLVGPRKITKT